MEPAVKTFRSSRSDTRKPLRWVFSLALRCCGCAVELRVNDIPLFQESQGASVNFTLPINEWLFHGKNEVLLKVTPLPSMSAEAEARLLVRRTREQWQNARTVGALQWDARRPAQEGAPPSFEPAPEPWEPNDAHGGPDQEMAFQWHDHPPLRLPGTEAVLHRATLHLPPSWLDCPWAKTFQATDHVDLRDSLIDAVTDFRRVLDQKRMGLFWGVVDTKCRDLKFAYDLSDEGVAEAILIPLLLKSGWHAAPLLPPNRLRLEKAGGGRLHRLVDTDTGESALRLEHAAQRLEAVIDAWWIRSTGNEWQIVR